MIVVPLHVGGGVRLLSKRQNCTCARKNYQHNEDGHTASGVLGHGSVPLSHSGNVGTSILDYDNLLKLITLFSKG